MNWILQIF